MSCSLTRMAPWKAMSSTTMSLVRTAGPRPMPIARTTLGLTLFAACRTVRSAVSLGVKEIFQSICASLRPVAHASEKARTHDDDILCSIGKGADVIDARRFRSQSESAESQRVEESRALQAQRCVDGLNDSERENRFVDEPEAGEELL